MHNSSRGFETERPRLPAIHQRSEDFVKKLMENIDKQ